MGKTAYPDDYTDEDKATYDSLMAMGKASGKCSKNDMFLYDMSARMTINQMKGYKNDSTIEEMLSQQQTHKDALKDTHIYTPDGLYKLDEHPMNIKKEIDEVIVNKDI